MYQILMIFFISLLILVHELGHFFAARLCGIRVTRFGIGMPFGPSFKICKLGHTSIYIHAFLFGGYVSFADDEATFCKEEKEKGKDKNTDEEELLPSDSPELYENKSFLQKLFVVSAGVLMNVIFAVILVVFCASFFHKLPTPNQNIYVDSFMEKPTSNAQELGVLKDDKILKINSYEMNSIYQLTFFAKNSKLFDDYAQKNLVEKNLKELKELNPQIKEIIESGTEIKLPARKSENPLEVNKNVLRGLEKYKKDGILLTKPQINLRNEIYNQKTYTPKDDIELNDLALALSDTYKPINMVVLRGDKEIKIDNIELNQEGRLGILLKIEDVYTETKTPKDIIVKSIDYLYSSTYMMLYSLFQLFTGKVNASDVNGVVAVVKVGGDIIASKGIEAGILLTAIISINLAIMNFLPIPALDGGHVMFLIVEKLTGRKPSEKFKENVNLITNIFFFILIILVILICCNDIFALITKKF